MPKKVNGYECLICGKMHSNEENAIKCENGHNERMKDVKILDYEFPIKKLGFERSVITESLVPTKIRIQFSDKGGDFATYRLEHYGYKAI